MKSYARFAVLAMAFGFLPDARAQYVATLMNPPGASVSRAWGAYGGLQAGQAGGLSTQTATLWAGTPASAIVLGPSGWFSVAWGAGPGEQVGTGSGAGTGFVFHALKWNGSAASMVDLHPAGYDASAAYATDGAFQTGQATLAGAVHAMAWSGSAASGVDLNPAGASESHSYGAFGGRQVGVGMFGGVNHALTWSATAASAVDLNGSLSGSIAYAMDATRQVGSGAGILTGGATHAMAWSGNADSVVDLNPAGFASSEADGIGANVIVGYGTGAATNNQYHALAWVGGSAIDLHTFLPAGYSASYAYGVDPITGNIVGEAVNSLNRSMAFMWTPVPEPTTMAGLGLGFLLAWKRRRR